MTKNGMPRKMRTAVCSVDKFSDEWLYPNMRKNFNLMANHDPTMNPKIETRRVRNRPVAMRPVKEDGHGS
jgi:hypothetical protein